MSPGSRPDRGLPARTAAVVGLHQPGRGLADPGRAVLDPVEALSPGIGSLRLPPALARAWKTDIATKKRTTIGSDGTAVEVASPRLNAKDELTRVRAFYLDIAHRAAEEPGRWARWVVSCPISDEEISKAKDRKHRKARMDQRTRERLPVLPMLADTVDRRRRAAAELLAAAEHTGPGT
ncbi:hypothetical protein JK361_40270 [Streptomyces sp. 5-8]|uniref:Uncharacterized protein n=1 Tax=Streptomyces musisoli TaxID=2802280 RepID=A0ABS1PE87_9ACTN|nr:MULTISPECIES: hypothetical protein [Streptomyces]MBL1110701.1 hypothetical protein [Streptomyces musisoli]MBY8847119.1 hypothetical protein [Streptomyces sp. SP2-10]